MDIVKQPEFQTVENIFKTNEQQVNKSVCKVTAYAFFIFPLMLLLNLMGIFQFSTTVIYKIVFVGSFCTISPLIVSKFVKNQTFIKYYVLICIIILVSVLGTEYYVGIYITFILAPIVSCMYFDKKFTTDILIIAYIGFLISYYFRSIQIIDILYPNESIWPTYIPLAAGFTFEFVVSYLFLYKIAERTRYYLLNQKKLIDGMMKREVMTELSLNATKDIFFEYDIAKDFFRMNGDLRNWEKKLTEIQNFSEHIGHIKWMTQDFMDLFQKYTQIGKDEGDKFQNSICISFSEGINEYSFWVFFEISIIRDEYGNPNIILGKMRNITEQKMQEIKAKEAENYDVISGMYVYSSFRKIIQQSQENAKDKIHQVMIIHITNYDKLKMSYGEIYRDFIVMNLSDTIKKQIGEEDVLACRLSENVFLLYVEDCDKVDCRKLRQDLNNALENVYVGEKRDNKLEFDFGYYLGEEKLDDLFKVALKYVDANEETQKEIEEEESTATEKIASAVLKKKKYMSIKEEERENAGKEFLASMATLIYGAKDIRSAIQISLAQIGAFLNLDGIRVYDMSSANASVLPEMYWTGSKLVERECKGLPLEKEVQEYFRENFANSRIVDTSIGAFQDFFQQFEQNPFLISGYSSIICPINLEESSAIILFDKREEAFVWEDSVKKLMLDISKTIGKNILALIQAKTNKEKTMFLFNLSHEIRTPMNEIVGMTEIARTQRDNPEQIEKCLDQIDNASQKIETIMNNILELSRMENGKITLHNELFSMEDLVARVEQLMMPLAKQKQVDLMMECKFQENLLLGDMQRIEQVLNDLIQYVLKRTCSKGKIHVLIEEITKDDHEVTLFFSVKDDGNDYEYHNQEKYEASDIGMTLCYNVIQMMGGNLENKSEENGGLDYHFTISLDIPEKDSILKYMKEKAELKQEKVSMKEMSVLIVEDNEINAEITKRLLEYHGAQTKVAFDGDEAVDIYQNSEEGEFDIILMDISMPKMNGLEATRLIRGSNRKDSKSIAIIAMSANSLQEDVKKSLDAGIDAYLAKPVQMKDLLEEISVVMTQKKRE